MHACMHISTDASAAPSTHMAGLLAQDDMFIVVGLLYAWTSLISRGLGVHTKEYEGRIEGVLTHPEVPMDTSKHPAYCLHTVHLTVSAPDNTSSSTAAGGTSVTLGKCASAAVTPGSPAHEGRIACCQ